jgi:hypothetical protein
MGPGQDPSGSSTSSKQDTKIFPPRPAEPSPGVGQPGIAPTDDLYVLLKTHYQDIDSGWERLKAEMDQLLPRSLRQHEEDLEKGSSEDRGQSTGGAMPASPSETRQRRTFAGFDIERATYQRIKPELLEMAEGKFVAIVGEEWVGPLDTDEEAERAGYQKFGLGPLYIKQVLAEEPPPALITRDVILCRT